MPARALVSTRLARRHCAGGAVEAMSTWRLAGRGKLRSHGVGLRIITKLKKEGWIEDMTFIPWTGSGGSQDGICRFTKAGEAHDLEIIRYYPKYESPYYEAVCVPKNALAKIDM
jgi:hypothetical protein